MAFVGRLHPLLIHFPIALALAAAAAEGMAILVHDGRWHTMAVGNVRAAAVLAVMAAVAGWRMATASGIETSTVLEWHRWIGTMGAGSTVAAAFATIWRDRRSPLALSIYRVALFAAAALVGAAGHLGGVLVWGADFLRF